MWNNKTTEQIVLLIIIVNIYNHTNTVQQLCFTRVNEHASITTHLGSSGLGVS